jgi:hypothetical protein
LRQNRVPKRANICGVKADEGADYIKDCTEEMSKGTIEIAHRASEGMQSQVNRVAKSVAAVCR